MVLPRAVSALAGVAEAEPEPASFVRDRTKDLVYRESVRRILGTLSLCRLVI